MHFSPPKNNNYCATIVEIKNLIPLENCDNVTSTIIFGFPVIISKDIAIGDIGVYFPPETQLSAVFCRQNNLYRHAENNVDTTKKGYIENTGRIRTVRFRGNQSVGLFMPLNALASFTSIDNFKVGDTFDTLNEIEICKKYYIKKMQRQEPGKKQKKRIRESKVLDNQFRFHVSTNNLGRCTGAIKPNDLITITKKMHGTSIVCSNVLCKKKLSWKDKIAKFFGISVIETEYDNIYSSRKVIKNDALNPSANHFYDIDIWGEANNRIKHALKEGITVYAEIVGYTPTGGAIQSMEGKPYDYGCAEGEFAVYVYRVTYTSPTGNVFEFSHQQLQEFCIEHNLLAVPEYYHGVAHNLCDQWGRGTYAESDFGDVFIQLLRELYLEQNCSMCKQTLPDEGIVVRREVNYIDAYKLKSMKFLEGETQELDKGNINLEDDS